MGALGVSSGQQTEFFETPLPASKARRAALTPRRATLR
jgi:hypothetical protein